MNNYVSIASMGQSAGDVPSNDPLSYCMLSTLDNKFLHGSISNLYGPESKNCQMYMSDYCANNWDSVCEYASNNRNVDYPNYLGNCDMKGGACFGSGVGNRFTNGDILVRNTAAKKYLTAMSANCHRKFEPFDPTNPSSPMISWWEAKCDARGACIPVYEVDPTVIDADPVMDKILSRPMIAMDILINIYNTAKRKGTFSALSGTKLGRFYEKNKMFFDKKIYRALMNN